MDTNMGFVDLLPVTAIISATKTLQMSMLADRMHVYVVVGYSGEAFMPSINELKTRIYLGSVELPFHHCLKYIGGGNPERHVVANESGLRLCRRLSRPGCSLQLSTKLRSLDGCNRPLQTVRRLGNGCRPTYFTRNRNISYVLLSQTSPVSNRGRPPVLSNPTASQS